MANAQEKKNVGIVRDLVTGKGTVCFLHTDKPNTGGTYPSGKYEVTFLFDKKDTATVNTLTDAALKAAKEKWGDKLTRKDIKIGIKNGDEKANLDGFAGKWFINPKSKKKPLIVGGDRQPLPEGVTLQSNDVCRISVSAGCYPNNLEKDAADAFKAAGKTVMVDKDENGKVVYYRPAVTFYLDMVQRCAGGVPFGAKANPNAFPEEAEGGFQQGEGPEEVTAEANPFG